MMRNAISQIKARILPAGKHADGHGLWLVKRDKSAGKWVLRLAIEGKRREMGLGSWPDVSIGEAREQAAKARRQIRDGLDPIVERNRQRRTVRKLTVEEAIHATFEARQAQLKGDGKAGRWLSPLQNHVIPKIGKMPFEDVDQHVIVDVLQPIWHEKADTARKAYNRINLTFQHCTAAGLEVDLQAPAKAKALLGKQRHVEKHIPSMPYGEVPAFYAWLADKDTPAGRMLQFNILTVPRTSELRYAQYGQVLHNVWTIPHELTKMDRPLRIPLSSQASNLIARPDAQANDLLFHSKSGRPFSDQAMSSLMAKAGYKERPHGFRSSFRTWADEQTDTDYEIKELCIGHQIGTKASKAYRRSDYLDKRRRLMRSWADFVCKEVEHR